MAGVARRDLDPALRLALRLVVAHADAAQLRLRFVARPEIFTHCRARAWLDANIGDVADHLILTDGATLKTLPGLRNHMFFYPRGVPAREAALRHLVTLAPELFAGLASQVNGALFFRLGAEPVSPPLRLLRDADSTALEQPVEAPFLFQPGDPDRAAMLCAEAALADTAFMAAISRVVRQLPSAPRTTC